MRTRIASFGDFRCAHCQVIISAAHLVSGVNNRNHCPYCLWSCHLDLFAAGDRLSACKAPMKPLGLTMKPGRNKYRRDAGGELMLVHQCVECRALSINRIAADDDSEMLMAVFQASLALGHQIHALCQESQIVMLRADDLKIVDKQLYGLRTGFSAITWKGP